MAKERLVIDEYGGALRICWYFPDSGDTGAYLGDYLTEKTAPTDSEHSTATEALKGQPFDGVGYYWETRSAVNKALVAVRAALKAKQSTKPYPEWAKQALAAGWKAPKGWQP